MPTVEPIMPRRKPGSQCILCGKDIETVGGHRLVATPHKGIGLWPKFEKLGSIRHPARTVRLEGDHRDLILVAWGDHWSDEQIDRAVQCGQAGQYPWFCARCVHWNLCSCGHPMSQAPGCDIINESGRKSHVLFQAGSASKCPRCDEARRE